MSSQLAALLELLYFPVLVLHIASGFVAIYGGVVPLVTKKGGAAHRRWGVVFTWALGIAALTAFPLAYWTRDLFQVCIGLLCGYLAWMGVRTIRRIRSPRPRLDWSAASICLLVFLGMALWGSAFAFGTAEGRAGVVFGAVGAFLAARDLRLLGRGGGSFPHRVLDHFLATSFGLVCAIASLLNTQFQRFTGLDWPLDWRMLLPVACTLPLYILFVPLWRRRLRGTRRTSDLPQSADLSEVGRLRLFAIVEGASLLLLLFVAMPLKYLLGHPQLVSVTGHIHGSFFVLYVTALALTYRSLRWSRPRFIWALVAAVVPGGTFAVEARLRRESIPVNREH